MYIRWVSIQWLRSYQHKNTKPSRAANPGRMEDKMTTEAQKRAQKRYDEANKDKFRMIHLKLNRETDADIIEKLEQSENIQGYIKELIRADI